MSVRYATDAGALAPQWDWGQILRLGRNPFYGSHALPTFFLFFILRDTTTAEGDISFTFDRHIFKYCNAVFCIKFVWISIEWAFKFGPRRPLVYRVTAFQQSSVGTGHDILFSGGVRPWLKWDVQVYIDKEFVRRWRAHSSGQVEGSRFNKISSFSLGQLDENVYTIKRFILNLRQNHHIFLWTNT